MNRPLRRFRHVLVTATLLCACRSEPGPAPLSVPEVQGPDGSAQGIAIWPDEAFRSTRPEPGPAPQLRVPQVERFTLSNGLEVYFVPEPRLPIVRMTFEFDAGATSDPASKAGMHSLCFDLLDEGTAKLDKVAFAAKLDDRALELRTASGLQRGTLSVRSLSSELPAALDAAREVLTEPGLRAADFNRLREQMIEGLEQQKATHVGVARRLLPSLVYGPKHPIGRLTREQSLAKVKVKDCTRMAKSLGPKGARLFVAAKIDKAQLQAALEAGLGSWTGSAPTPPKMAAAQPSFGELIFVDMPGSAQSTVQIAAAGPKRNASDYAASSIMTRILGGGFSSRLNMNLREDKGYAYGARGGFSYHRGGSHLVAGARVRADSTVDSVRQVFNEITAVREGPLEPEELARERDGALAALPGAFGSASRTLGTFRNLVFYGLALDWYEAHAEALRGLDLDAVESAGREHLPTDAYVVLVVGDGAVVRNELQSFATDRGLRFVSLDADGERKP